MNDFKILVIAREGEAMNAYRRALESIGVNHDAATSFRLLSTMVRKEAYSGLIIDMLTLVRAGKEEKTLAYELMNFFPSAHIKWDTRTKAISLSVLGEMTPSEAIAALTRFIEDKCRRFTARKLRMYPRKDILLQVMLAKDPGFPDAGTDRTFSVNASKGGCFVHTVRPMEAGDTVWLKIAGMTDQTPIKGIVCWKAEWGEKLVVPGIGVRFEKITPAQVAALEKFLQTNRPGNSIPDPLAEIVIKS